MRLRRLILLLFAILSACASSRFAPAQDADSARAFIESLDKLYTKGGKGVPLSGASARHYYHSSLIALMRADAKAVGPGDVGAIDGDPVCGCQDWEGIWDLHIDIQMPSPNRAVANVTFFLAAAAHRSKDDLRRLSIVLVPENGQWRIWDIRDQSDPKSVFDVRDALEHEIRQAAKRPKTGSKR